MCLNQIWYSMKQFVRVLISLIFFLNLRGLYMNIFEPFNKAMEKITPFFANMLAVGLFCVLLAIAFSIVKQSW